MAEQCSESESQLTVLNSGKINFFYSFRPIYYFSRIFGFMPFTIVCDSNGTIQGPAIRSFDIFWFIVSILLYLLSAFLSFKNAQFPKNSDSTESVILIRADHFLLLSGLMFGALIILMDMCNRFKLVGILKNIKTFDEEASQSIEILFSSLSLSLAILLKFNLFQSYFCFLSNADRRVRNSI